jgi:signal transduction histidine kinase
MLKSIFVAAVAAAVTLAATSLAAAQQGVTSAEGRAMLEKAIAELKADEAVALAKFNKGLESGFADRDLYVFCYKTTDGKLTAHTNKSLLGRDIRTLKDGNGEPFGQRIFDTNKEGTISTVDYSFARPGAPKPVPKRSYITVVGNQGCGADYYK